MTWRDALTGDQENYAMETGPHRPSGCIAQDNSRLLPDKARVFSTLKCIKNHIIFLTDTKAIVL